MTPQAIVLNHLFPFLLDKDHLGLPAQGKHGGMPESVFGFEVVLVNHIVVGYVAIVAGCFFPVRAMTPGGILWCHNMAIHTGRRIIGEIGIRSGNVKHIDHKSGKESGQDQDRDSPPPRRRQFFEESSHPLSVVLITSRRMIS